VGGGKSKHRWRATKEVGVLGGTTAQRGSSGTVTDEGTELTGGGWRCSSRGTGRHSRGSGGGSGITCARGAAGEWGGGTVTGDFLGGGRQVTDPR
jgi:hypothetical protein